MTARLLNLVLLTALVGLAADPDPGRARSLWAVGTVEIVVYGHYELRMRGGFPWNGEYHPVGPAYFGYDAVIRVTGMAESPLDDPPCLTRPSPVEFEIVPLEPRYPCDVLDADGDGDVDLRDFWLFQRFMTGPGSG